MARGDELRASPGRGQAGWPTLQSPLHPGACSHQPSPGCPGWDGGALVPPSCPAPRRPMSPSDGAQGRVPGPHWYGAGPRVHQRSGQGPHWGAERRPRDAGTVWPGAGGKDRRSPGRQRGHTDTPECRGSSLGSPGPPCSRAMQMCWQEVTVQRCPWHPNIPAGGSRSLGRDGGTRGGTAALLQGTGTELAGPLPPAGGQGQPGLLDTPRDHGRKIRPKRGLARSLPLSDHRPH